MRHNVDAAALFPVSIAKSSCALANAGRDELGAVGSRGTALPATEGANVSRIQQVIKTLEAERTDLRQRLAWLERQLHEFRTHDGSGPPARASRRTTTTRRKPAGAASRSRARSTSRSRGGNTKASIIEYLAKHPGSTAGDVASGLNLNRGSVSTRLTQLAKAGEIKKAARGYTAK